MKRMLARALQALDTAVYVTLDKTLSTLTDLWWRITRRKK